MPVGPVGHLQSHGRFNYLRGILLWSNLLQWYAVSKSAGSDNLLARSVSSETDMQAQYFRSGEATRRCCVINTTRSTCTGMSAWYLGISCPASLSCPNYINHPLDSYMCQTNMRPHWRAATARSTKTTSCKYQTERIGRLIALGNIQGFHVREPFQRLEDADQSTVINQGALNTMVHHDYNHRKMKMAMRYAIMFWLGLFSLRPGGTLAHVTQYPAPGKQG